MEVTLYIPCFNSQNTIRECLDGVLKQSHPPSEILVINDGSTDLTSEFASDYPVRIINHGSNKGLACARNTAIRESK